MGGNSFITAFDGLQWNNKGYDRAVKYAKKFTHISPVWLQVVPSNGKTGAKYEVKGTHDIDKGKVYPA